MKNCSKCHQSKPYSDFYSDKSVKGGLSSQCKECQRARAKGERKRIVIDDIEGIDDPLIHPVMIPEGYVQEWNRALGKYVIRRGGIPKQV